MRILARLAALAALPLLAGCFDYSQNLTVTADGTATLVLEAVMSAELVQMDPEAAGADFCDDPDIGEVPEGFTATTEATTRDDGSIACTVTVVGPLDNLQAVLDNQEIAPGGVDDQGGEVTLTNEGNGEYTYTFVFNIPKEEGEPDPQQEQMQAMMLQMMADGVLSWSVTAPRIISSDGTIEGNTATYTLPLTALMTDQGETKGFTVRFALR